MTTVLHICRVPKKINRSYQAQPVRFFHRTAQRERSRQQSALIFYLFQIQLPIQWPTVAITRRYSIFMATFKKAIHFIPPTLLPVRHRESVSIKWTSWGKPGRSRSHCLWNDISEFCFTLHWTSIRLCNRRRKATICTGGGGEKMTQTEQQGHLRV